MTDRVSPTRARTRDGNDINVRKVIARGSLNGVTFAPGAFSVATYETAFDGETETSSTNDSSSFGEQSSTSATIVSHFVDEKTWSGGDFEWTLESDKETIYTTTGERFVDGDLVSQLDSIIGGGGSSFVGNFTRSGTQTTREVLRETGNNDAAMRDLMVTTSSTSDHQGGRQNFRFTDVTTSTSTLHSTGSVSRTGAYSITVQSNVTTDIVSQTQLNGPSFTSSTGGSTVQTTSNKTGNSVSGDFTLDNSSTFTSNRATTQTNQTLSSSSASGSSGSTSLTGSGNDETGEFSFLNNSVSSSSTDSQTSNSADNDFSSTSQQVSESNSSVHQTGNLYEGIYVYVENFGSEVTTDTTTVNGTSTSTSNSVGTTTGAKTTSGNKKDRPLLD